MTQTKEAGVGLRARLASVLALAVLLAGCGAGDDEESFAERDVADLVGLWRVDADQEEADTWLRVDGAEFALWRGRGMVHGDWRANDAAVAASTWGFSGEETERVEVESVEWLDGIHAYRWLENGWQLLDDDGEVLATMRDDGAPEPIDTAADELAEPPELTDEERRALTEAASLPEGLTPATPEELLGRWVPAGPRAATDPHVTFEERTWSGTDGCNGGGGVWLVDGDGALLTTAGPSTLIGCEGAPVPAWVAGAAGAGFDEAELVLADRSGAELGRLVRD